MVYQKKNQLAASMARPSVKETARRSRRSRHVDPTKEIVVLLPGDNPEDKVPIDNKELDLFQETMESVDDFIGDYDSDDSQGDHVGAGFPSISSWGSEDFTLQRLHVHIDPTVRAETELPSFRLFEELLFQSDGVKIQGAPRSKISSSSQTLTALPKIPYDLYDADSDDEAFLASLKPVQQASSSGRWLKKAGVAKNDTVDSLRIHTFEVMIQVLERELESSLARQYANETAARAKRDCEMAISSAQSSTEAVQAYLSTSSSPATTAAVGTSDAISRSLVPSKQSLSKAGGSNKVQVALQPSSSSVALAALVSSTVAAQRGYTDEAVEHSMPSSLCSFSSSARRTRVGDPLLSRGQSNVNLATSPHIRLPQYAKAYSSSSSSSSSLTEVTTSDGASSEGDHLSSLEEDRDEGDQSVTGVSHPPPPDLPESSILHNLVRTLANYCTGVFTTANNTNNAGKAEQNEGIVNGSVLGTLGIAISGGGSSLSNNTRGAVGGGGDGAREEVPSRRPVGRPPGTGKKASSRHNLSASPIPAKVLASALLASAAAATGNVAIQIPLKRGRGRIPAAVKTLLQQQLQQQQQLGRPSVSEPRVVRLSEAALTTVSYIGNGNISRGGGSGLNSESKFNLSAVPFTVAEIEELVPQERAIAMLKKVVAAASIGVNGNNHEADDAESAVAISVPTQQSEYLLSRVYQYWAQKRSRTINRVSFIRCYHEFMMKNWQRVSGAGKSSAPSMPAFPEDRDAESLARALSLLLRLKKDLDCTRTVMDRVRRREKIKRDLLRVAGAEYEAFHTRTTDSASGGISQSQSTVGLVRFTLDSAELAEISEEETPDVEESYESSSDTEIEEHPGRVKNNKSAADKAAALRSAAAAAKAASQSRALNGKFMKKVDRYSYVEDEDEEQEYTESSTDDDDTALPPLKRPRGRPPRTSLDVLAKTSHRDNHINKRGFSDVTTVPLSSVSDSSAKRRKLNSSSQPHRGPGRPRLQPETLGAGGYDSSEPSLSQGQAGWLLDEDKLLMLGVASCGIGRWCDIRQEFKLDRNSAQMCQRFSRLAFGHEKSARSKEGEYGEDDCDLAGLPTRSRAVSSVRLRQLRARLPSDVLAMLSRFDENEVWDGIAIRHLIDEQGGLPGQKKKLKVVRVGRPNKTPIPFTLPPKLTKGGYLKFMHLVIKKPSGGNNEKPARSNSKTNSALKTSTPSQFKRKVGRPRKEETAAVAVAAPAATVPTKHAKKVQDNEQKDDIPISRKRSVDEALTASSLRAHDTKNDIAPPSVQLGEGKKKNVIPPPSAPSGEGKTVLRLSSRLAGAQSTLLVSNDSASSNIKANGISASSSSQDRGKIADKKQSTSPSTALSINETGPESAKLLSPRSNWSVLGKIGLTSTSSVIKNWGEDGVDSFTATSSMGRSATATRVSVRNRSNVPSSSSVPAAASAAAGSKTASVATSHGRMDRTAALFGQESNTGGKGVPVSSARTPPATSAYASSQALAPLSPPAPPFDGRFTRKAAIVAEAAITSANSNGNSSSNNNINSGNNNIDSSSCITSNNRSRGGRAVPRCSLSTLSAR